MEKQFGLYTVCDTGKVFNTVSLKIIKKHIIKGYECVFLYENKKAKYRAMHRLIAELFIPNPNNYRFINHKDGNKLNNNVENLEWCTSKQNMQHAFNNNLIKTNKKVIQKDLEGNILNIYESLLKACYATQTPASNISACCNFKRKQANDFLWSFA